VPIDFFNIIIFLLGVWTFFVRLQTKTLYLNIWCKESCALKSSCMCIKRVRVVGDKTHWGGIAEHAQTRHIEVALVSMRSIKLLTIKYFRPLVPFFTCSLVQDFLFTCSLVQDFLWVRKWFWPFLPSHIVREGPLILSEYERILWNPNLGD